MPYVARSLTRVWTSLSADVWTESLCVRASQMVLVIKKLKKKNLPANIGDIRNIGSIPEHKFSIPENIPWRRKLGIQYPCLENPMDRGTWQATVQKFGHD